VRSKRPRLSVLLAPRDGEFSRGMSAVALGLVGQLSGVGLLASAAWLITTASLRPPVLTLTVAIAAVRMFALLRGTARYGERLASHDLALRALARMRVWAFARLEPLVPGGWPGDHRGDLLARFVSDVDGLQDLYVRLAVPIAGAVSVAVITVLAASFLDPLAGLVLGIGLGVATLVLPLVTVAMGTYGGNRQAERRGDRDGLVVELLHGSSELTVFGAQAEFACRLRDTEQMVAREDARASLAGGLGHAVGVVLGGFLAAAVVAASLPAFDAGRISGVVVAVLGFLALGSADAIASLPESFAKLSGALGGARRILALEGTVDKAAGLDRTDFAIKKLYTDQVQPEIRSGGVPDIVLEKVSILYKSRNRPVLDKIDLTIPAESHIALIGPSGAGKTTIGHLLMGFVEPTRGSVTFDGVDLRRLDTDAARRLVAWAPQDPHVFHTTLAANLRLARPGATDDDLLRVLGNVGLKSWCDDLSDGLSTMLGERGNTVSGGERQRLGVARALLADRSVLILDEPTAHLDAENESLLRDAVLDAATGKTLVWITHRLGGLDAFDEVVMLRYGRRILREQEKSSHVSAHLPVPG